jgi:hypothetical protein
MGSFRILGVGGVRSTPPTPKIEAFQVSLSSYPDDTIPSMFSPCKSDNVDNNYHPEALKISSRSLRRSVGVMKRGRAKSTKMVVINSLLITLPS